MSGIVGVYHTDARPLERRLILDLTTGLRFRGPDNQQVWMNGHVGLGHALLRTSVGSENEYQPCSLDGRIWITADARIDGRKELIADLSGSRLLNRELTDTELILMAYQQWGTACTNHLRGDFAFAIWDGNRERLFCVRDHFGIKPFYYAVIGPCFIFSNTLSCMRHYPHISSALDEQAVADFLLHGFCIHPEISIYMDIKKLPPGHQMIVSSKGFSEPEKYWSLPVKTITRYKRSDTCITKFKELMHASVSDRIRTDRIGVLMSGGMDSTAIAAEAKECLSEQFETYDLQAFTLGYERLISDHEKHYATLAAQKIGIRVHHLELDASGPGEDRKAALLLSNLVRKAFSAKSENTSNNLKGPQVLNGCRVGLCGHGGDELFHPGFTDISDWVKQINLPLLVMDVIKYWMSYHRLPQIGIRTYIRHALNKNRRTWRPVYPPWLNQRFENRLNLQNQWRDYHHRPKSVKTIRSAAFHGLNHPLWQNIFESFDPGMTGIPVELRYPYLDLRIVSFCISLPPIPWCVNKELLRIANRDCLPDTVTFRSKTPLSGFPDFEYLRLNPNDCDHTDLGILEKLDSFIDLGRFQKIARHPERIRPGEHTLITHPLRFAHWLQYLEENMQQHHSRRSSWSKLKKNNLRNRNTTHRNCANMETLTV